MTLTPAQLDVVRHLDGRTVQQIADDLYLSPHTIKTHLANARRATGTNSRAALIAWADQRGLL